jgi:hypothetical protein
MTIKTTRANPDYYRSLVDGAILNTIARGVTQFDQLITALPGVYPSVALASLRRLALREQVPGWIFVNAMRYVKQRRPQSVTSSYHLALPIPHPLDYDWRFSDAAIQHVFDRCLDLSHLGDTVALLGTPSVLRAAIEKGSPRQWVLLDINAMITDYLTTAALDTRILQCDVTKDPLPELSASLVIVDSPWYEEHVRSFLWAACQLCAPGGHLLVSLPPVGTRPGIAHEWAQTLDWAQQLGLTLLRLEPAALPYMTPPFERNALKAEGLYKIPDEWRQGDLAVFFYAHPATIPRPLSPCEDEWMEEVLLGMRIRMRPQHDGHFHDPSLLSLVPGDILSSVSRREPRRRLADVWTSGNRIFACQGRHILRQIVHAVAVGQSPCETIAASLHRPLLRQEAQLIARAAHKILWVARLERKEHMLGEEGQEHARMARTSRA